ncbi:hypothetical protein RB195_016585 [Necator americanus]|uniref:Uncharacterized protein n=1 Tax=Necator americanus TaxID=51031 RepID=A0ABR1C3J4_NECAM
MNGRDMFACPPNYFNNSLFTVADNQNLQYVGASISPEPCTSTYNFNLEHTLQEILGKIKILEEMSNKDFQQHIISEFKALEERLNDMISCRFQGLEQRLHDIQGHFGLLNDRLLPRQPLFLYSFVPYEKVQSVFHENRESPVRFALALEPLVYAAEPWEMQIPVNKRIRSAAKVEFIRNCVFRHFNVPNELQEDIWKNVRVSLNCRARRHRTSARSTPISGFRTSTPILLEIESDDSNENGNK